MKEIIKKGKKVEDAVKMALEELGLTEDQVEVEVISEGNKGIFGIGSKDAEVIVRYSENKKEDVTVVSDKELSDNEKLTKEFLSTIFDKMGIEADIAIKSDGDKIDVDVSGEKMGIIIGRRGETLSSLQYLTNLVVNRKSDEYVKVSIDTENYKQKREEALIRLANKTAEKVVKYKRSFTLEPMNPYERRIIHSALQSNDKICTYSTGNEPMRRVVIAQNRENKEF